MFYRDIPFNGKNEEWIKEKDNISYCLFSFFIPLFLDFRRVESIVLVQTLSNALSAQHEASLVVLFRWFESMMTFPLCGCLDCSDAMIGRIDYIIGSVSINVIRDSGEPTVAPKPQMPANGDGDI